MSIKRAIGYILLVSPIVGTFVAGTMAFGIKTALLTFASVSVLLLVLGAGAYLTEEK